MGDFMEKLRSVKPWIIRDEEKPLEARRVSETPAELEQYKQFSMCINCMLCYAACPVYGLEPEFVGPAAIALAQLQPRLTGPGAPAAWTGHRQP